jgi:hypothetical protein
MLIIQTFKLTLNIHHVPYLCAGDTRMSHTALLSRCSVSKEKGENMELFKGKSSPNDAQH